ncbi:uncharacterized protein LOC128253207 isoform X2 [Drosophila gunungcola]|uniref:uncharacterized protein LOC128253207 isoform X2 n=1 Tax=Drosophila gunungcola TaxID=103775 RepID=UPI0022E50CD2|nr:uncharacterized protein LOC128253207 isoform X2 [Drosophila gunungcola]
MTRGRPFFWISSLLLFGVLADTVELTKTDPNVLIISQVLSYMDESVEPCQNFRNYSAKYAKRLKPPSISTKFQIRFDELKDQEFEDGSLEGKMQRFYNICLARKTSNSRIPPAQQLTLQELENQYGMSLAKFLEYIYDQTIPPSAVVHVKSQEDLIRFKVLLTTFNPDIEFKDEIYRFFHYSLSFPVIERVHGCVKTMNLYLQLASNLLYEERILGPEKNWTTPEIKDLQKSLNNLTLSIANIPEGVNHREFVTNFYKDLDFTDDDDYDSAVQKSSEYRRLKQVNQMDQSLNTIYSRGKIIVVPYNLLENRIFELESHDLFKMTELGIQLVFNMLEICRPRCCIQLYGTFLKMFDDNNIITANLYCSKLSRSDDLLARQQVILMVLNLVHEAYFATDSKFNQIQPSFTTKTLSQLSFLRMAQSFTTQIGMLNEMINNILLKLPSFAQAFNCPHLKRMTTR